MQGNLLEDGISIDVIGPEKRPIFQSVSLLTNGLTYSPILTPYNSFIACKMQCARYHDTCPCLEGKKWSDNVHILF